MLRLNTCLEIKFKLCIAVFMQACKEVCIIYCTSPSCIKDFKMEYINSSSESSDRALNTYLWHVYTILQIVHLVTVIIPSLVAGSVVLYCLYRIMSRTGIKPIMLLYTIICIFCIIGSVALAIFWVLGLYSDSWIPQNNTVSCAIYTARYVICYTPVMFVCYCIGMTSIVQFVLLHSGYKKFVSLKSLISSLVGISVASLLFTFVLTVGSCVYEQQKLHIDEDVYSLIPAAIYIIVSFVVPLFVIVIFSILTHLKVKRDVSYRKKAVVRSVLAVNGFNIAIYALFRAVAVLIYFVGYTANNNRDAITKWLEIGRYISDLGYLFSIVSILILDPRLRSMALACSCNTDDQTAAKASSSDIGNVSASFK